MSDTWSINGLCRCCHAECNFKSIDGSYSYAGMNELFFSMLRDTFVINMTPFPDESSSNAYSICAACEPRLQDAAEFKRQVVACEEKFKEYYSQHVKSSEPFSTEVKVELHSFTDEPKEESSFTEDNKDIKYNNENE